MIAILKTLFPKSLFSFISALLGGLSIAALINKTYDDGFRSALDTLIAYYDRLIDKIFGWARQPLEALVKKLLDLDVELSPIWIHVSILTGIYLLRNVHRLYTAKRPAAATYQLVAAIPILIFAGVGAGASYRPDGSFASEVAVTVFPLTGIFIMIALQGVWFASFPKDRDFRAWPDFGGTWLHFVGMQIWYGLGLFAGGLALSILFTLAFMLVGISHPAILVILLLVICLAIYWMAVASEATRGRTPQVTIEGRPKLSLWLSLLETPAGKVGLAMVHTVMIFLVIVLINAGLSLLGL